MSALLRSLFEGFVSSLFPPICAACPRAGREPFCRACADAVVDAQAFSIDGAQDARARFEYGGPVATAIQALKYRGRAELGRSLGKSLSKIAESMAPFDAIVPVPLSRKRLYARGYNQARELARGLPHRVLPFALLRRPDVREQVGLDKKSRLENLKDAFLPGKQTVEGLDVLLLDDVVTTGATASAAATTLMRAGARRVRVLALARTP